MYNVKFKVKPAGHLHTATNSLSCGEKKTICGSLDDIVCIQYGKCEEVVLLLGQIIFLKVIQKNHLDIIQMSEKLTTK